MSKFTLNKLLRSRGVLLSVVPILLAANAWAISFPMRPAIDRVNLATASERNLIAEISSNDILTWYKDFRPLRFTKEERGVFDQAFNKGFLPDDYQILYKKFTVQDEVVRIVELVGPTFEMGGSEMQMAYTLVKGLDLQTWDTDVLPRLLKEEPSIAEPLRSKGPKASPDNFPASVQVKINEIKLSLAEPRTDVAALDVNFLINSQNIGDLADYFGTGYDRDVILTKLQRELGKRAEVWVNLKQILLGWPAKWVNRFPKEMSEEEGIRANDTCHGIARQFFSDVLLNGSMDRSTEATEWLLRSSYVLLKEGQAPQFGDYLYLPGRHSIRFILRDPGTRRWIGFSSYSSWETPYRIWWVDQDYRVTTYPPLAPVEGLESAFDVWRIKR